MSREDRVDICIIGSGFAGSILAWALARSGKTVGLLDRQKHPRFAVGESSTPLADFLLREIGTRFGLPEVLPFCTWGSWKERYPQVRCGKKRGFSYFQHSQGLAFWESDRLENSYLVAATAEDRQSDTHWMRSDFDAWLFEQAKLAGVQARELADISHVQRVQGGWQVDMQLRGQDQSIFCDFLVDSSGSGELLGVANGLSPADDLETRTSAVFGHFRGVGSMVKAVGSTDRDPFCSDDAAQHHLLDCGLWCWMLRFDDGTTSVGFAGPESCFSGVHTADKAAEFFSDTVSQYPTLQRLLDGSSLVAPYSSDRGPRLAWIPKIGRRWPIAAGADWAMLPTTAGIVDPLHSTGIAHALSGVLRLLDILVGPQRTSALPRHDSLGQYGDSVAQEVQWIDQLVAMSYRAMALSFDTFVAVSSLYFVAAVQCERSVATNGSGPLPDGFLLAKATALRRLARAVDQRLEQLEEASCEGRQAFLFAQFTGWLREQIAGWNDFGLLCPENGNRVWRSTIDKPE